MASDVLVQGLGDDLLDAHQFGRGAVIHDRADDRGPEIRLERGEDAWSAFAQPMIRCLLSPTAVRTAGLPRKAVLMRSYWMPVVSWNSSRKTNE